MAYSVSGKLLGFLGTFPEPHRQAQGEAGEPTTWMQSTEEGLTGLRCGIRSGDVMDIESWPGSERCDKALKRGDDGMPSTTTWAAGFLLRKGQSREALGKWLTNRAVPWKRRFDFWLCLLALV